MDTCWSHFPLFLGRVTYHIRRKKVNNDFSRISKVIESAKELTKPEIYSLRKMLDGKLKRELQSFKKVSGDTHDSKSITGMFLNKR